MRAMPRPRPPHLLREVSRHGTVSWVVRTGHGPRTRLRAPYGSPQFQSEYHAAVLGEPVSPASGPRRPGAGTLRWLWDRYRESSAWAALAPATRRQRENIMYGVLDSAGNMPLSALTKAVIVAGRERRAKTPAAANHFLHTMRSLFAWAIEHSHVTNDPTEGVKNVKLPAGGFHAWTEAEIDAFETRWPIGTRERLAFAILLYTGLRRGDAAMLGRQHVKDGVIVMRAGKTGTQLTIPILPELARVIAATKTGDLTFVTTATGKPMVKESFGNWFGEACDAAGVPGSAHGLRKAGAARAASNGATVAQLEAIFGWSGGRMAAHYTKSADRVRLAKEAIGKLSRNET
jgi:integrase